MKCLLNRSGLVISNDERDRKGIVWFFAILFEWLLTPARHHRLLLHGEGLLRVDILPHRVEDWIADLGSLWVWHECHDVSLEVTDSGEVVDGVVRVYWELVDTVAVCVRVAEDRLLLGDHTVEEFWNLGRVATLSVGDRDLDCGAFGEVVEWGAAGRDALGDIDPVVVEAGSENFSIFDTLVPSECHIESLHRDAGNYPELYEHLGSIADPDEWLTLGGLGENTSKDRILRGDDAAPSTIFVGESTWENEAVELIEFDLIFVPTNKLRLHADTLTGSKCLEFTVASRK